ncbi:MAG: shikimate dehydrogenase [Blastocatellia bacterium]|jgi:3-dehydroquinate dehydratase/shikimate dehydrogenase|nr:shikimate dehydrogenase [Blastocatellia bacterium]
MTAGNSTRICAVVCEQSAADLPGAIARAAVIADMVEVRLDCLLNASLGRLREVCLELIQTVTKPVIITLRSATEGGNLQLERDRRRDFWRSIIGPLMSATDLLVDLEGELVRELMSESDFSDAVDWERVICSYHDFAGTAEDLNGIYDQLATTPARIIKIAKRANNTTDCIPMFRLLERAVDEQREIIPIAMGTAGLATRVLGPSRGAFLTYGSTEAGNATAPGQISVRELGDIYRVRQINLQTQTFGLIGNPVSHSISPQIQNAAFSFTGIDAVYLPFEVRVAGEFLRRLVKGESREVDWNLRGLSVTAPHKSTVTEHLDWIEPSARDIGAVNTMVVDGDLLRGYNTDAAAFLAPLKRAFGPLEGMSCAVIGAGGAARTAIWSLRRAGAVVTMFARNAAAAKLIGDEFGIDCKQLEGASFTGYDVVVNATPVGMRGELQNQTLASAEQLRGVRLVYDLVYNPTETLLLKEAASAGCGGIGGLEMLLAQAAAQFTLWTGEEAPLDVMRAAAESALSEPPAVAGG